MKINKVILFGLLIGGTGMLFSSCSDYLDEEKNFKNLQTEDKIFTDKDFTEQWLSYCYANLLGDNMEMGHTNNNVTNFSDDIVFNEGNNGVYYQQYKLGQYERITTQAWARSYDGIRQASVLIQDIDKNTKVTEEERTDIKGQARFLRAYFYWLLLRK